MITAVLDTPIVAAIERHCAETEGVETGGVIFIGPAGEYATGPGPNAVCTPHALQWDSSYILGCIETARAIGCEVWGRWHKHPAPVILSSEWDRRSAEAFRRAVGADEIVDVIVGCDGPAPIGWAAYLCTGDGYERVHLNLPEGSDTEASEPATRLAPEGSPRPSFPAGAR